MSGFCYEDMVQDALLSVVKKSLIQVATHGLDGDHHFYISFKTGFNDVVIPDYLAERHPDEMMIVIQYQYADLQVTDYDFSVSLSFNGNYERLTIPFNAIVAFVDPSVRFGLQFSPKDIDGLPPQDQGSVPGVKQEDCKIINFDNFRKK